MKSTTYFTTENALNIHFAIIGKTGDEFCSPALKLQTLESTLHEHLKTVGYEMIAYYHPQYQIHFYDKDSYDLAKNKNAQRSKPQKERLLKIGPISTKVINNEPPENNEKEKEILNLGPMNSYVALGHFDRFMKNTTHKNALVITNASHFIRYFSAVTEGNNEWRIDKRLETVISGWQEIRKNKNICIWIFKDDINDQAILDELKKYPFWTIYFSPMLLAKPKDRKGTVIEISTPNAGEIKNLIHYHRIKNSLAVDLLSIDNAARMLEKKAEGHMLRDNQQEKKLELIEVEEIINKMKESGGINMKNLESEFGKMEQESAIKRLNELSGLDKLKEFVNETLVNQAKQKEKTKKNEIEYRDRLLKKVNEVVINKKNLHIALLGNPGTGKTTIAKLLGEIYRELGILPIGSVTKVTRPDLVGEYSGQTAPKTRRAIMDAMGGVLFIDEAYDLYHSDRDDFGIEACNTLLEAMTDREGEFAVIVAGYPDKIEALIESNSGFYSRFKTQIKIEDYSSKELADIFINYIIKNGLDISDDLKDKLEGFFERYHRDTPSNKWANARTVISLSSTMKDICEAQNEKTVDIKHIPHEFQKYLEDTTTTSTLPKTINSSVLQLPKADIFKDSGEIDIIKIEQAVPFIIADKSEGSGFLISPSGHIVTCDHVIKGANEIYAIVRTLINGVKHEQKYKCEVINSFDTLDIALLKIDTNNLPYLNLELNPVYVYKKGEETCLFGYPFGSRTSEDCSFRKGHISSKRVDENDFECISISILAESGFSGGPILDMKTGMVIGVFPGSIVGGDARLAEQINWFRPIKYFWKEFVK